MPTTHHPSKKLNKPCKVERLKRPSISYMIVCDLLIKNKTRLNQWWTVVRSQLDPSLGGTEGSRISKRDSHLVSIDLRRGTPISDAGRKRNCLWTRFKRSQSRNLLSQSKKKWRQLRRKRKLKKTRNQFPNQEWKRPRLGDRLIFWFVMMMSLV